MTNNFYKSNRQKVLFMVRELHKRGFGKLRVIPSLSPSGTDWRCSFSDAENANTVIVSNWVHHQEGKDYDEIKLTAGELADLFVKENSRFMKYCTGKSKAYEKWYSDMLDQLEKDELPYAFADWDIPEGYWETTEGKQIKTISD